MGMYRTKSESAKLDGELSFIICRAIAEVDYQCSTEIVNGMFLTFLSRFEFTNWNGDQKIMRLWVAFSE